MKFLAVIEVEVYSDPERADIEAQATLDNFRELMLPSVHFGVDMYRAWAEDLTPEFVRERIIIERIDG